MKKNNLLSHITERQKIEILRKNWMSHDARCQMAFVRELGWEKGNKLNKDIVREVGKVAMYRLINALGISQVKNMDELQIILKAAMDFYYPSPAFAYHLEYLSNTSLLGVIKKCNIYENVKKVGVAAQYECGCFAIRSGWYEALGINVEEELLACLKNGNDTCKIAVKVKKWGKKK